MNKTTPFGKISLAFIKKNMMNEIYFLITLVISVVPSTMVFTK